jgi:hypothetical protein
VSELNFLGSGETVKLWVLIGDGGDTVKFWPSGERGGDLAGRFEMGDGGTKGNDSRIESARVDVPDMADDADNFLLCPPCACA